MFYVNLKTRIKVNSIVSFDSAIQETHIASDVLLKYSDQIIEKKHKILFHNGINVEACNKLS